jgi:zinc transporter 2
MADHDDDFKKVETQKVEEDSDLKSYNQAFRKLKIVTFVSVFFIVAQCIGGYLANSIAIFTDSAHLASDLIGFGMSMIALRMSMRPASKELTFGWHRAEIIGTMISVIFLFTITIWLLYEAMKRVIEPQEVKGFEMMVTAIMGLFFNLIQMKILHQGDGHYHLGGEGCGHSHSHAPNHSHDHKHDHENPLIESEHTGLDHSSHKSHSH